MNKQAASKDMAGYQQTRKSKRPIRVHNLLKKAALPGAPEASSLIQDVKDSGDKTQGPERAIKALSRSSAELGPIIKSAEMIMIENDPLIRYLKKTAAEKPPTKVPVSSEGQLEVNEAEDRRSDPQPPVASMCPYASPELEHQVSKWHNYLETVFGGKEGITKKYLEKDVPVGKP